MPILFLIISALTGLFTFTSIATFREVKKKKQIKKSPKFVQQWKKIKNILDK